MGIAAGRLALGFAEVVVEDLVIHQALLLEIRPETFSPCKVATVHWSYVELDRIDNVELKALVREAYAEVAPKRLAALAWGHPCLDPPEP